MFASTKINGPRDNIAHKGPAQSKIVAAFLKNSRDQDKQKGQLDSRELKGQCPKFPQTKLTFLFCFPGLCWNPPDSLLECHGPPGEHPGQTKKRQLASSELKGNRPKFAQSKLTFLCCRNAPQQRRVSRLCAPPGVGSKQKHQSAIPMDGQRSPEVFARHKKTSVGFHQMVNTHTHTHTHTHTRATGAHAFSSSHNSVRRTRLLSLSWPVPNAFRHRRGIRAAHSDFKESSINQLQN